MASTFTAPLSFAQEQLWFLDRLDPGRQTYNVPLAIRMRGPLDVPAVRSAVTELVRRHETLRTTIDERDGKAVQVVAPAPTVELSLPVEDGRPQPGEDADPAARRLADADAAIPFDLRQGPLFRPRLFRIAADDHLLTLCTHHIISDGWSLEVIVSDIGVLYEAARAGTLTEKSPLPELPVQYADFAAWQRERLAGEALEEELRHWARTLAGAPVLELPTDRPRPVTPSFAGNHVSIDMASDVMAKLRARSREHRATMFMVIIAAFNVVLSRYSGQRDIVIGTASAGRDLPELKGVIGFFTNMVVLRTDLSGDPTFLEILQRVREVALTAYTHQEVPFEKVVERVGQRRDPSRNPLFQVAMALLPAAIAAEGDAPETELRTSMVTTGTGGARFDIGINVGETGDALRVFVEYATDLFDRPRIVRMIGHFEQVLAAAAADPTVRLSQVPMLTDAERQQVLHEWQGPAQQYRRAPVHQLIAEQAARAPDAVAAVCAGAELTYGELERRAGLVARYLRERGVTREDVVGVGLERGLDVPVALVGVLKAGAAFLAVDPSHPAGRNDEVLRDARARFLISQEPLRDRLPTAPDRELLALDAVLADAEPLAGRPLAELADADSMMYVLYTSGSTGRPKGVVVEHGAMCNYMQWLGDTYEMRPGARVLQYASLVFDLAEAEIFTALSRGATLVLVPEDAKLSPPALSALIRDERCTYIGAPPALLGLVDAGPYPDLRGLLVGGEAFSGDLVNRWNLPGRTFVNGYGPTESTVGCIRYICEHITWRSSPPIGRALPNRTAYLVDEWNNPVPVGVPGEILIGGEGLARGYLGRPDWTAERFTEDPFVPGGRVYRTGDLAAWTEEGQIQFLGRIDTQVKLRGQRIELEEIEAVLTAHPAVAQALVAMREDRPGEKRLVGYVLPGGAAAGTSPPAPQELRELVARELPPYMVPAVVVVLDELPLTPSGKVDRAALPAPAAERSGAGDYLEPRTATERTVAEVFATILGLDRVGATDDFFELGGSSLQVAAVINEVRDRTGVTLPMRDVYTTPTVGAVAAALDAATDTDATGKTGLVLTLRATGDRPPLICIPHVFGSSLGYRSLVDHLPDDQPLYALEAPGLDDDRAPVSTMEGLAEVYIAAIREHHPRGPYVLAGHSMGGVTAYEMGLQLAEAGEDVTVILVEGNLDPQPPAGRAHIAQRFVDIMTGVYEKPSVAIDPELDSVPEAEFLHRLWAVVRTIGVDTIPDEVRLRRGFGVFAANASALWAYRPSRAFPGPLTLIRSVDHTAVAPGKWVDQAGGGLTEYLVPGDHYSIWSEPNLTVLAATFREILYSSDRAEAVTS